jgi:hypothetical protein
MDRRFPVPKKYRDMGRNQAMKLMLKKAADEAAAEKKEVARESSQHRRVSEAIR